MGIAFNCPSIVAIGHCSSFYLIGRKMTKIILLCLLTLCSVANAKAYRISTIDVANPALLAIEEIMTAAYSRIGLKLEVVRLPAKRALPDANVGKYDGELYRIKGIGAEFPNLQMVPTSIGSIEFVAYGIKKANLHITNWNSLKIYRLAAMLGIKKIEYETKGMRIVFVATPEQLLRMLYLNRVDIILVDKNTMLQAIKKAKIEKDYYLIKNIIELKKLDNLQLYHYLHIKNKNLIPLLDQSIQDLVKNGTVKSIWEKSQR
jgi:polar amino acid transport system substrate-binding protein